MPKGEKRKNQYGERALSKNRFQRPQTPDNPPYEVPENKEKPTPSKAALKGALYIVDQLGLQATKQEIFDTLDIPARTAYRMLKNDSTRRSTHENKEKEYRGRPKLISDEKVDEMIDLLRQEKGGFDARSLPWVQLGHQVDLYVSEDTIKRAMKDRGYKKCIACQKTFHKPADANKRKKFCREHNWTTEEWAKVRFCDEVHFGLSPKRKLKIIRKEGERYCEPCVQRGTKQDTKDMAKFHCYAIIGKGFKSDLWFYTTSSGTGSMTQDDYIERVLTPFVKPLIDAGHLPLLEEDNDSSHGTKRKDNKVWMWKEENGLKWYANPPASPDFCPLEKIWRVVKQRMKAEDYSDENTLKEAIITCWNSVEQELIDQYCDMMPDILDECLHVRDGQMTAH